MLGIIVRVELYEGCAAGVPFVVAEALTLSSERWRMRLCDERMLMSQRIIICILNIFGRQLEALDYSREIPHSVSKLNFRPENEIFNRVDFQVHNGQRVLFDTSGAYIFAS